MKIQNKYNFEKYDFLGISAFYEGKLVDGTRIVDHLEFWCPEVNWDLVYMYYPYRGLVKILSSLVKIAKFKNEAQKDDYKFTDTMVIYKGQYLGKPDLVKHLYEWWPDGVNWWQFSYSQGYRDLKLCLECIILDLNQNGSNRLCICDGMDECLSRTKEKAHETRAADNE